jgi:hypothetical protein
LRLALGSINCDALLHVPDLLSETGAPRKQLNELGVERVDLFANPACGTRRAAAAFAVQWLSSGR